MIILVKIARNLKLGLGSLWSHRLRSLLTIMGIVFGVASVVCMLSIGEGLSYEAREQIRRLGSNNIIVRSVKPPDDKKSSTSTRSVLQYGLTYADVERIQATVPKAEVVVPARELRKEVWFQNRNLECQIVGTVPWYPQVSNADMLRGRFFMPMDMHSCANVCVLNRAAWQSLRTMSDPFGDFIRISQDCYRVIGIIDSGESVRSNTSAPVSGVLYVPLTALRNRQGELFSDRRAGSWVMERVELHQMTVRVKDSDFVVATARLIENMLKRTHDKADFEMIVPLELLREKERVKRLYNIVLGLMAAISLVVGGIGIMNIMLATVSERTPEIGIRRAIGAKKHDIILQFLTETVLLSGCGGLLGIALGVGLPKLITYLAKVPTITTTWSVLLAFGISACIGVVFGFYPAVRAAQLDPMTALRHE